MKKQTIFLENCSIIDVNHETPSVRCNIVIEAGKICNISNEICRDENALKINLKGHYVLPGLIDNHIHVTAAQFDLADEDLPDTYIAIQAAKYLEDMLQRGFTSVRDAGGAGYGLVLAGEDRLFNGPRLFISGKAISQTGGHGDFQSRNKHFDVCFCHRGGSSISVIADGKEAVRKAVREQIRRGANQIKIMASGGISSPNDKVTDYQFSEEEIQVIVEEARAVDSYVMAHAYAPIAIQRCVRNGVRTIEHGNLLDEYTAKLMQEYDAFLVPTMVTYYVIADFGASEGFPEVSIAKLNGVLENAKNAVKIARKVGVKVGFGSDLLGPKAHRLQSEEFNLRVIAGETPHQVITSATAVNAEILQYEQKLGVIKEGAYADLIAVKGNPLNDIGLLVRHQADAIELVMKDGHIYKNSLTNDWL